MSGSFKNGFGLITNVGSVVLAEGKYSTREPFNTNGAAKGDLIIKQEFGLAYVIGASYKHTFIDKGGRIFNEAHSVSIGGLGFLGATLKWNSNGLQNVTFGIDASGNVAIGIGASGSAKLGGIYFF